MKYFLVFALAIVSLLSCKDDRPQSEIDEEKIVAYLAENNITAERHSSGLYYEIIEPGGDHKPGVLSNIKVTYEGKLTSGSIFDAGTFTVPAALNTLIEGWQIGIPLIGIGGKINLYIPSGLGYGSRGSGPVPGNSVTIFEVELLSFS